MINKFAKEFSMEIMVAKWLLLLGAIGCLYYVKPFYVVNPGQTAVHLRLGALVKSHEISGWYFKFPVIDNVLFINNRICKSEIETTALSKDLQFVSIGVAINYRISDALKLYKHVGTDFVAVIIDPFAQESIKAVVAKYTAENLIQSRHEAKDRVCEELKARLQPLYIDLVDFNFVHLDFHADFIKAVEDKQIAQQKAMTAKNKTEQVREEMIQSKERTDAEAYALKVKRDAVTEELIELQKVEALHRSIDKWDGRLPNVMSGTMPFIDANTIR